MDSFFVKDFTGGPFVLFSTTHLWALAAIVLLILYVVFLSRRPDGLFRRKASVSFRYMAAFLLVVNELSWHVWNAVTGQWTIQTMLPLHLCSALVWLCAYMLVTKNYRIYEFAYVIGIAGALQAILTPDLGIYDFPHYRYFQVFLSHGLIVTSAIYMTLVEGFRPTWNSLKRVFLWGNVYLLAVGLLNWLIGSNYLFVAHKPETASLLDMLGPWPFYLIPMEVLALVLAVLLYVPFAVRDGLARRRVSHGEV
jgi:hypothetical integral membrane protein (TIGR02206 family)